MKSICLFGAGKSATVLIEYLISETSRLGWQLCIADGNAQLAASKAGSAPHVRSMGVDILDSERRESLVQDADLVISLLPPRFHVVLAKDCVRYGKHLLTASYVDADLRSLEPEIRQKGILVLGEMGLDPGIDHMSAMQIIHRLRREGARIRLFRSHCGGLVAPESDDNPWRYKISWNPGNIVSAGKAGARFREQGQTRFLEYAALFDPSRVIDVPDLGYLSWYPNRDSLTYIPVYGLEEAETFIRTTLRYPEFCFGWKNIIELRLTDETVQYQTDGMSLQEFFRQHFNRYGFSDWVEKQLTARFAQTKQLLEKLQALLQAEQSVEEKERRELQEFMMINESGELRDIHLDEVKTQAAATVAGQMHEANLSIKQLIYLGMDDASTLINKGQCSAMEVLQFALEKKLPLLPADHDMVVMLHEFDYTIGNKEYRIQSRLLTKGENDLHSAMARTVGYPLGIAAIQVLSGQIRARGLRIPVDPEIYEPVLKELERLGIRFEESTRIL